MLTNENLINKLISIFGNEISFNSTLKGRINIVKKDIDEGFIFENLVVISQYDIENIKKQSIFINKYNIGRKIKGFEDLKKGDYVVHVIHGIGQYQGLVTLEKNKIKKERQTFAVLFYANLNLFAVNHIFVNINFTVFAFKFLNAILR